MKHLGKIFRSSNFCIYFSVFLFRILEKLFVLRNQKILDCCSSVDVGAGLFLKVRRIQGAIVNHLSILSMHKEIIPVQHVKLYNEM